MAWVEGVQAKAMDWEEGRAMVEVGTAAARAAVRALGKVEAAGMQKAVVVLMVRVVEMVEMVKVVGSVEVEKADAVEKAVVERVEHQGEGVHLATDTRLVTKCVSGWSAWCPGADRASSHSRSWER